MKLLFLLQLEFGSVQIENRCVAKSVLLEVCAVDRWSVAPAINKFYQK